MKKLAVLVSGTGSLLEAMVKAELPIAYVATDRMCRGFEIGTLAYIETDIISRSFGNDFDRAAYTVKVRDRLRAKGIECIALAGFMTTFSADMFRCYEGLILNTHPSLLPAFPGAHAVRDALAYGVQWTGCTIHLVTEKLDHGLILAQQPVHVKPDDTESVLHERIKDVERALYPRVIRERIAA